MNIRECTSCGTHIPLCDRCGADHPEFAPAPPFSGTINGAEYRRICGECYHQLVKMVFEFYGKEVPDDWR